MEFSTFVFVLGITGFICFAIAAIMVYSLREGGEPWRTRDNTVEKEPNISEPNISEPVISFVNQVKNNPRRFKVSVDKHKDEGYEWVTYTIKDRRSDFEGTYSFPVLVYRGGYSAWWECDSWWTNKDVVLTSDEQYFIEEKLVRPYIELLEARRERRRIREDEKAREELTKIFKEGI